MDVVHQHPVAVYACNHLSYMDTPAIFAALPFQFRILARSDLWKIPFIGWHLNRSGQIPVAVDNPRASIASLTNGVRALKAGMPLFVFPEGGRSRDGRLGSFMSGPAYMAIRAGVPLIPMALVGTYELLPIHTRHFSPRPLELRVGAPLPTAGRSTREAEALTAELRRAIEALLADTPHGTDPHGTGPHQAAPQDRGSAAAPTAAAAPPIPHGTKGAADAEAPHSHP
jgi:1-acyl-sn-glycerol-3-phosphate acyltransferase